MDKRQQSTSDCTTRAQHKNTFATQCESQVVRHIAHQTNAVKVFAEDLITFKLERINGTRQTRSLRQRGGISTGLHFEWHGHIETTPACSAKRINCFGKAAERPFQRGVVHGLPA